MNTIDKPRGRIMKNRAAAVLAAALAVCMLVAFLPAAMADPGQGTWQDHFATTRQIASTSGTKVAGGALKLSESAPAPVGVDDGVAVPGESGVYSMVALGADVYSGTGEKGHLVQYAADKVWQEGHQGPSHYGVSSSKGQVSSTDTQVTALTTDGAKIFGGTSAGHVFTFETTPEGKRPEDKESCPGATGGVTSMAFNSGLAYCGTSDGYFFTYDDTGPGFNTPVLVDGASRVDAIVAIGGDVYIGLDSGHVFKYSGGVFSDLDDSGAQVNALSADGATLIVGGNDGRVRTYDTTGAGPFVDRGGVAGASPVKSLAVKSSVVFAGCQDGHVYSGLDVWTDQGVPPNTAGAPVNALAVTSENVMYGGTGADGATGRLIRYGPGAYENYDRPAGSGDANAMVFTGKTLYMTRGTHLLSMTAPGNYVDHGESDVPSVINAMDAQTGFVLLGREDGHLYSFNAPEHEGSFYDEGAPASPSPVTSVVAWALGSTYVGLRDGRVMSRDMTTVLTDVHAAINAMCYNNSSTGAPRGLYIACADNKLYRWDNITLTELNDYDATPVTAVAASGNKVYLAHGSGNLYTYDGSFAPDGTCPSPVTSMAPASQGVVCGTSDGKLFVLDSTGLFDQGTVPNGQPVKSLCHTGSSVWAGTEGGYISSHDDANLGDLGQEVNKQIMVWCITYDPVKHLFYAGTYTNAHFLVINPATNSVTDLGRPIPGEREIEDILVMADGTVYGATYGGTESLYNPDGGHLFKFDPDGGSFEDLGKVPSPSSNWWVSCLVKGDGGTVIGATCPSAMTHDGSLFSYDGSFHQLGSWPAELANEGPRTLVRDGNKLYGGTWDPAHDDVSHVFSCNLDGGGFTVLGEAPPDGEIVANKHINRIQVVGNRVYCAQNNGNVFSFDPAVAWAPAIIGKPVSQSTSVYPLTPGEDSTILCGTTGGTDLAPRPGHLVSYDPSLEAYRDIDVSTVTTDQDRVASIGMQTVDPLDPLDPLNEAGTILCGTRGMGAVDRTAAKLFRVDRAIKDTAATALSTVVDPLVASLTAEFASQDGIGAVCPAPGDAKRVFVGTSNSAAGPDAQLYLYDTMTEGLWPTGYPIAMPSGQRKILSMCRGPDGLLYIGTGNDAGGADSMLLRFDPNNPGPAANVTPTDLAGFKGIFALATGQDGKIYIGAGDNGVRAHLFSYDPQTTLTVDLSTTQLTAGRITGLVSVGSVVYGVTGSAPGGTQSVEFFKCAPGFTNLGTPPACGGEREASGLALASDGKIYCGTGPEGRLISWEPGSPGVFANVPLSWLQGSPGGITSVAAVGTNASDATVLGCAGPHGNFFKYKATATPPFTDMGPLTVDNNGVTAATTDNLGKAYFGTIGSGTVESVKLVRYNPTASFQWLTASATKNMPTDTTATVSLRNVRNDTTLVPDVETGIDIHTLTDRALRFQGALSTTDSTKTPTVASWGAVWTNRAVIDQYDYYAQPAGVYRGDMLGIWGSNFGNAGTVTIGGATASGDWHPGYILVTVPEGATSNSITISPTSGQLPTDPGTFNLLEPPSISSISPPSASRGAYVDVHGSNFMTQGPNDWVSFNGVEATSYASWTDTLIRVKVPEGATTGNVTVSVNYHVSPGFAFTVNNGGGPVVRVTSPANGSAVKGAVNVQATVQRSGGTSPIELWVDGAKVAQDPFAPYTFDWNADSVPDGAHALTVKATDDFGRTGSASATVYVDHTVPSASQNWYFGEGCTNYGFETWVLIGNPNSQKATATVTFMDDKGKTYNQMCSMAPNSRTTVNAADVAPGANISVQVAADRPVVCERAMYWGNRVEGHDTVGATALSTRWYFAEGSSDYGFQTFVLLGNPGTSKGKATVTYMFKDGTQAARVHDIAPHSRVTIDAGTEVGARDFSVKVTAQEPGIVAEESVYHGSPRRCGTNTIGCQAPSLTWYLSEGSTDWGFETWLLISRPAAGDAQVTATYRKSDGGTVQKIYLVKGNSRYTVNLANEVGVADVSTQVTSNVPVVCERSMYWNQRTAGHTTIGSPGPGRTWLLAEGCTDYGFETWVLLDNPNARAVNTTVTFLKGDGTSVPVAVALKPQSRLSIDASNYVGRASFSTRIDAASPVMVERAMYWNGRIGGTDSIGAR